MMSMRIPPPAAAPPPQTNRATRETSGFGDALRDRDRLTPGETDSVAEAADAEVATPAPQPVVFDALIATWLPPREAAAPGDCSAPQDEQAQGAGEAAPDVPRDEAAPVPDQAPPVAPVALDALIAQMLPSSQALHGLSAAHDDAAPAAQGVDNAPEAAADPSAPPVDAPKLVRAPARGFDHPAPDQTADASTPAPQAEAEVRAPRAAQTRGDEAGPEATRAVAVRKVSSAQHYPVVADPVRQIVDEVQKAFETAPVRGAAPEVATSGVRTLNVQLEPESLGTVTLRMRLSGNQLSVRVDVAEPATLDMIQRERDRLQKSMATESVAIDRLEIRATSQAAPVAASEGAGATRQELNPQGQPSRQNGGGAQNGEAQRHAGQGHTHTGRDSKHGQQQDSTLARSGESRGVYL